MLFAISVALVLLANACHKEELPEGIFTATPYNLLIPRYFPTQLNVPEDNPLTVEGVRLGRYLFYDTRLCGYVGPDPDSMMSCASCHVQAHNFDVGLDNPRFPGGHPCGLSGLPTTHTPLPLVNLVFNSEGYFWNGLVSDGNHNAGQQYLEDIVTMTITAPDEMNSTQQRALKAIASAGFYDKMFEQAFGTPEITIERIEKALAQFVRVLVSGNSKFDRYLRGEEQLSDAELRGYVLFTTENTLTFTYAVPPPGKIPSSTAAFVADNASSILSFLSGLTGFAIFNLISILFFRRTRFYYIFLL